VDYITGNNQRILFVDDEDMLVDIGVCLLEDLGYNVEGKTSALEALEIFRNDSTGFDLVISDINMPEMRGDKFIEEIRKINSDIPVLLSTGFDNCLTNEKELGVSATLQKPVTMEKFALVLGKIFNIKT